jgi:hypothetical protein
MRITLLRVGAVLLLLLLHVRVFCARACVRGCLGTKQRRDKQAQRTPGAGLCVLLLLLPKLLLLLLLLGEQRSSV